MVKKLKAQTEKRIKRNHKFQLNINRGDELWLHEWIQILTKQRKFSQYVRDGLSLMIYFAEWGITAQSILELIDGFRQGSLMKLFELWPHFRVQFEQGQGNQQDIQPQSVPVVPPNSDTMKEIDELRKSNEQLRQMVEDLTALVLAIKTNNGYLLQSEKPAPAATGPKLLTQQQFALPTFEDDDDETKPAPKIATKVNTSLDSSLNLVKQMMGLNARV